MQQVKQAHVLQPGAGERLAVGAGAVTIKIASEHSGGSLALLDYEVAPGFPGPPLHVHPDFDELFVVTEGTLAFRVGSEAVTAPAGTIVYTPGDEPHTFSNPG